MKKFNELIQNQKSTLRSMSRIRTQAKSITKPKQGDDPQMFGQSHRLASSKRNSRSITVTPKHSSMVIKFSQHNSAMSTQPTKPSTAEGARKKSSTMPVTINTFNDPSFDNS